VSPRASRRHRRLAALLATAFVLVGIAGYPRTIVAASPPTMTARVLLQGHARLGSWIAILVHLHNEGASVTGELRLQGGTEGGTRYATPVQLDNPSDKDWLLYAQPPSFGQQLEVVLASGPNVIARQKVAVTIHDPTQLIVGVVAEDPRPIIGGVSLPAVQGQGGAVVVPLSVADLPTRIEAWSALDRLVWQDVDAASLSAEQLAALRGWIALGGRLVIVGGTAGIGSLGGFPDDLLPYRPTATVDVAPTTLTSMLGSAPKGATDVPAMAGELVRGHALAAIGDRVVAAQTPYGSGSVTVIGVDPTVGWIAASTAGASFWPNLIPPRTDGPVALTNDGQIVSAVGNLPALSLPPLAGLLLLLFGYVLLIGPLNYLVLRRLDRREWAWVTMPLLIVGFAVAAYAFGSALRGSSVIVNEVAIVRGAPDASEGSAQVYLGVFSPARGTYQVAVPGGALLSSPIGGDVFGGQGVSLDVVQGDPSRVRDLAVGFGSLRTIRAESQVAGPKIHAELTLVDGTLTGSIRNDAATTLERPAVVLGGNVKILRDLAPGDRVDVNLPVANGFGQSLSDQLFGQVFFDGSVASTEEARRNQTRHLVLDQLTNNQDLGAFGRLPADGPVILAWGRDAILDVTVEGQAASRVANVLYYVPVTMGTRGRIVFTGDLLDTSVVAADATFFSKDPSMFSFGRGSTTMAYRPIPFQGTLAVSHVRLAFGSGPDSGVSAGGVLVQPLPPICAATKPGDRLPAPCPTAPPAGQGNSVPDVEVFDRTGAGSWHRLPRPAQGQTYDLADPARYVDPATGTLLVRYVNNDQDQVAFFVSVAIEGTIR